ncbi:MAG: 4-hydroxythreonine-4-phosphate dehydrogenase PdxA [Pseudomonadota bacterium]|nr:4-hydroxythreonine-4-phosphate dehydrogenase PdxA [Pseudomonadota bacterium]
MYVPRIIVTSGEPAGIGPDICVMLARHEWPAELIVAGDRTLLQETAAALGQPLRIIDYASSRPAGPSLPGVLTVLDVPTVRPVRAGKLDPAHAAYVLRMLDRACDGCMNGEFAAMVTAPIQKSTIIEAGYPFTGHTEYLAGKSRAALPVMMLVSGGLRVALVTTHLALSAVPSAITADRLAATLRIVHGDMERHFGFDVPRIMVLGLNPHAGESGYLGREEIEVIEPVLASLRTEGLDLRGPVPADTAFAPHMLAQADAVVAMYHDQGLPVLKHVGFGNAVNITLGLPILRTSVDHGTALPLARTGQADPGSLRAAVTLAVELVLPGANRAGP